MVDAGVQAAIAANDNNKRLTHMTKFYGNAKDTLTASKFIVRLEQAAAIRTWNNTRKCAKFCHLMYSEANGFMSATLKKAKRVNDDWDNHKKLFLQFFDIKGMAKLNFLALHDMNQGPKEKVQDFWTKIQVHC